MKNFYVEPLLSVMKKQFYCSHDIVCYSHDCCTLKTALSMPEKCILRVKVHYILSTGLVILTI